MFVPLLNQFLGRLDAKDIHLAVVGQNGKILVNGADLQTKDRNCETVLHMAVADSNEEAIKILLDKSGKIEGKNTKGPYTCYKGLRMYRALNAYRP